MRMKLNRFAAFLLACILASILPAQAYAASIVQLTPSVKASFDRTAAVADAAMKERLTNRYTELAMLQTQYDHREEILRTMHSDNEQALIVVRRQINEINSVEVSRLEAETKSLKARHQPLFDQYSALNRRISIVKKLKDKNLNKILQTQGEAMKIMVQLAREDIRGKEAQWKNAKDVRSKKMAAARKTLAAIDSSQSSIRTEKSVATALNKRLSADWSSFKASIRKPNPGLAAQSLVSLNAVFRQIAASKQKIVSLEQKIAGVIEKTEAQIGF